MIDVAENDVHQQVPFNAQVGPQEAQISLLGLSGPISDDSVDIQPDNNKEVDQQFIFAPVVQLEPDVQQPVLALEAQPQPVNPMGDDDLLPAELLQDLNNPIDVEPIQT